MLLLRVSETQRVLHELVDDTGPGGRLFHTTIDGEGCTAPRQHAIYVSPGQHGPAAFRRGEHQDTLNNQRIPWSMRRFV